MNYRLIAKILGYILTVEAATMLAPAAVCLIYGEPPTHFLISAAITLSIGFPLTRIKRRGKNMRLRDGFIAVGLAWLSLSFFGGLPFLISGEIPRLMDAFFEAVSGFTTTGATILPDVEALSRGSLFWRSFTQWLGGMGVLVFVLAILPTIGGSTQLIKAESPGPSPEKLVPRASFSAKMLYKIYLALTAICIIALAVAGMPVFDSFCHGFATAGTGGFSIYSNVYAHYDSLPIELVTTVFMLVFSINFTVYYKLLIRQSKSVPNEEVLFFLGLTAVAMLVISLGAIPFYGDAGQAFRQGTFQAASMISTTGYYTDNFDLWPQICKSMLMFVMITGACAGSTAGGLKISRVLIVIKQIKSEIRSLLHPRSVRSISLNGKVLEPTMVSGVMMYVSLYFIIIVVSTLIVSLDNKSFDGTFSAVLAMVNNIGVGFSEAGPGAGFAGLSVLSKATFSFCMLLGRLEILPMVLLITPGSWKRS